MKIQITIDGPADAIKELYQKLSIFSPIIENPNRQIEGKDEKARIILLENEENLDNKLLRVSRIVKKLQKDLSRQGRILVEKRYNWETNMRKLEKLLKDNVRQSSFSGLPIETEKE